MTPSAEGGTAVGRSLDRLPEYAEMCRQLHNRVRRLLPKAEQDELLTLTFALGVAALEQQRVSNEEAP